MPLMQIRTTGIEDYMPDGEANLKSLIVGGPGAGKTRWSSYWPGPIYADCEAGRASIADRKIPYVEIHDSEEMLQWVKYLQQMCDSKPRAERPYRTAVVDTLDSFLRKVKNEYLLANPEMESFRGYDAWGYLDTKMQALMTRLLNLDMNVIVLCHYKDKTYTEGTGDNKVEVVERMLQLQGDIKDSAFNDFDLVGRMQAYFESDGEKRVQKRGITFQPTPDWPFLKDRLHCTPKWLEVRFDDSDYTRLFERFMERAEELEEGGVVGEIEPTEDENAVKGEGVTGPLAGGPVPPQDPKDMPLDQLKKDQLVQMARDMPAIADKVKTNMVKAEIINLIEEGRQEAEKAKPAEEVKQPAQQADEPAEKAPETSETKAEAAPEASTNVQDSVRTDPATGKDYDPETGEIMTSEQVAESLGAEVISEEGPADKGEEDQGRPAALEAAERAEQSKEPAKTDEAATCDYEVDGKPCGRDISQGSEENRDFVKLAWIKFRRKLCNEHYQAVKAEKK